MESCWNCKRLKFDGKWVCIRPDIGRHEIFNDIPCKDYIWQLSDEKVIK